MKKFTLAVAAAAALVLPATAQETEQQFQLDPETLAKLQQQLQSRPSFDFTKLETILPDVIGEVNGEKYTKSEFIEALRNDAHVAGILAYTNDENLPQALHELAQQMMTVDMLGKLCPELTEEQAKAVLIAKIEEMPEANLSGLETALKQQGTTLDEYVAQLVSDPATRKSLALAEYFDKLIKKEGVANEEAVKKFYEENRETFFKNDTGNLAASHILIALNPDASEAEQQAALAKAEAMLKAVRDGADFGALARENSDCPSKANGGNLGSFAPGDMVPEFSEAVMKASVGELIDHPVKTQFGYHIIRRNDVPQYVPFNEVEGEIAEYLKQMFVSDTVEALAAEHIKNFIVAAPAENAQ